MTFAQHVVIMKLSTPSDAAPKLSRSADLVCLSHLRWNFVFQRPQHLMSRYARTRRVFFVEEPIYLDDVAEAQERVRLAGL